MPHGAGLGRAEKVDGAVLGEAAAVDDLEVEVDRVPPRDLGAGGAARGQGDVLDVGQLDVALVRVGDALSRPAYQFVKAFEHEISSACTVVGRVSKRCP